MHEKWNQPAAIGGLTDEFVAVSWAEDLDSVGSIVSFAWIAAESARKPTGRLQ